MDGASGGFRSESHGDGLSLKLVIQIMENGLFGIKATNHGDGTNKSI